ncbi:MAG TPA: hypothetical protein VFH73_06285, partial [Polyangia bacterium]|nr:hypothetical protein [Polyangia bacterium]
GMIKRDESGSGDTMNFTMIIGDNPGTSATFSDAQAAGQAKSSVPKQFAIPFVDVYSIGSVAGTIIRRSRNNKGAWIQALDNEVESLLRGAVFNQGVHMVGDGFGARGQVSAPGASTTLTLTVPTDVFKFQVGQTLVLGAANATGTLRAGTIVIAGLDEEAGTLLLTANLTAGIAAAANNDFIFVKGDRQDAATPVRLVEWGWKAWLPATAPSAAENFGGVDRSTNSRMYGRIKDCTGIPLQQALIQMCQKLISYGGGKNLICVVSPNNHASMSIALGTQARYVDLKTRGQMGFKQLAVAVTGIDVPIQPCRFLTDTEAYVLDLSTWKLVSCGPAPTLNDYGTGEVLVNMTSDDGIEIRVVCTENFKCFKPAANAVLKNVGS